MTSILTQKFKKNLAQMIYDDVVDSDQRYFVGIGRSEDWDSSDTPPDPVDSLREARNARLALQSVKRATAISFVVPRNNWSGGTIYSAWSDNVSAYPSQPYYVMTEDHAVYLCLRTGRTSTGVVVTSTVKPTGSSHKAFTTSDGYVWKFLYTVTSLNSSNFLTANFLPVRLVGDTDSSSPALDLEQKGVQDAAVAGQISSIRVVSGGSGYTSAPAVSVVGDGTGASATATVSSGRVVKVVMDDDSASMGSGYNYAEVKLTGGGASVAATVYPVLSPKAGFGADPRDDLRATALMVNAKPAGDEDGSWVTGNDFRQIVLLKNILKADDSDFTGTSASTLNALRLSSVSTAFTADRQILGAVSAAKAWVDSYDPDGIIYFHQTEETGFAPFAEGENVTEINGAGSGTLDSSGADADSSADSSALMNRFSGEVLYINNRAAVSRSASQTEDIKIVISL